MDAARRKILELLASGHISVDQAVALFDEIGLTSAASDSPSGSSTNTETKEVSHLHIQISGEDEGEVNIRVPLSYLRSGTRLGSFLTEEASETIRQAGFDFSKLSELDENEFMKALTDLSVDIDREGKIIKVFCE